MKRLLRWLPLALLVVLIGCVSRLPLAGTTYSPESLAIRQDSAGASVGHGPATLRVRLGGGYGIQTLPNSWATASLTLSNSTLLQSSLSQTVSNPGSSTLSAVFSHLRPGSGYALTVDLYNSGSLVASGSASALSLVSGGNTVAVTLALPTAWVLTYAGNGTSGLTNGATSSAEFHGPFGVAVDGTGDVFVGDYDNNVIREITPVGVVSTYAGNGTAGLQNGATSSAEFSHPSGVAVDAHGNVFVGDDGNDVIREITTGGVVSTYAGNGIAGLQNGATSSAEFNSPKWDAVDATGDVFVGDWNNNVVREITPAGVVSIYAGNGTAGLQNGATSSAEFSHPAGVAVDAKADVFVVDNGNKVIREITSAGFVSTYAGSGTAGLQNGATSSAEFSGGAGVVVDSLGNVYEGDFFNHVIREITPAGFVSTYAGSGTAGLQNGATSSAEFHYPRGVAMNANGDVFVGDFNNNVIREILP